MNAKQQLEKRLIEVRKQQAKYEAETIDLMRQALRLKGRCYDCEHFTGRAPGDCIGACSTSIKAVLTAPRTVPADLQQGVDKVRRKQGEI